MNDLRLVKVLDIFVVMLKLVVNNVRFWFMVFNIIIISKKVVFDLIFVFFLKKICLRVSFFN